MLVEEQSRRCVDLQEVQQRVVVHGRWQLLHVVPVRSARAVFTLAFDTGRHLIDGQAFFYSLICKSGSEIAMIPVLE